MFRVLPENYVYLQQCIRGTVHTAHKHRQRWTNQIHPPSSVFIQVKIKLTHSHCSVIVKQIRICVLLALLYTYMRCTLHCIDMMNDLECTGWPHVKSVYSCTCLSGVQCSRDPIVKRRNTENRGTFGKRQQSVGRNDNLR